MKPFQRLSMQIPVPMWGLKRKCLPGENVTMNTFVFPGVYQALGVLEGKKG